MAHTNHSPPLPPPLPLGPPPPDTLGRLRVLEAHVLRLGARSPLLATWVKRHGILDETRQLFRDLPRVPYALMECPDALLYLVRVMGLWDRFAVQAFPGERSEAGSRQAAFSGHCPSLSELGQSGGRRRPSSASFQTLLAPSGAPAGVPASLRSPGGSELLQASRQHHPGPRHADYAWALRSALRDDFRWSAVPRLRPPALRRLLAELPAVHAPSPWALRLLTWAAELGPEDWLPLLLCTPALAGHVGPGHVRDALCSLWPRLPFRSYSVALATACLHAAHPGLVDAGTRRTMVLRERMYRHRTAALLGMGMMDGWDRDPELGRVAATLGFSDLLLPFVWFSRLSELEWALVAHAARSLAHGAGAADKVRRWAVLRDLLRDLPRPASGSGSGAQGGCCGCNAKGSSSQARSWHLPPPAARAVADFLGLDDLAV
jgi:hypothetical protein